jgi:uncharacterized protein (TIGR02996 family)
MHESFLQSIIEAPDDDGPRLIYADWLDEHGEADRAEFIRLQCAVAQLPAGDRRLSKLRSRERALRKAHPEWLDLQLPKSGAAGETSRGFVEHISLLPELFLKHASSLFARFPIRSIAFLMPGEANDEIREVAASPLLARLTAVSFRRSGGALRGLGPAGLRVFLGSAHLENLRSLNLKYNDLESGAAALAGATHLRGLTSLDLHGNRIETPGVEALAGAAHLGGLTSLVLGYNRIGPGGAAAIAGSPHLTRLTLLDLSRARILSAGVRSLAASANLSGLQTLGLNRLRLGILSAKALVRSPHLRQLRVLELRSNKLGNDGAEVFASSSAFPNLTLLDLRRNFIAPGGMEALRARFGRCVKL